jgi:hypothetical protein
LQTSSNSNNGSVVSAEKSAGIKSSRAVNRHSVTTAHRDIC